MLNQRSFSSSNMRISQALKVFPRAITKSKVIHFIWDMEHRSGPVVFPLCLKDYLDHNHGCIQGSFIIPDSAIKNFPEYTSWYGLVPDWKYCDKCLARIKKLEEQ